MVDAVYTHVEIYGSRVSSGQRLRPVCQIQPGESTFYFRFPPLVLVSLIMTEEHGLPLVCYSYVLLLLFFFVSQKGSAGDLVVACINVCI
jgi:hypothetical protein